MDFERHSQHTEAGSNFEDIVEGFWGKTDEGINRLLKDVDKAKYLEESFEDDELVQTYQGRPLIGRDLPILGGVYIGAGGREAIVVDEKYGKLLPIYQELLNRQEQVVQSGGKFKDGLLNEVWNITKEYLPYNDQVLEVIDQDYSGGKKDYKITLDTYIDRGGGVCRHQALLAGYLIEKLGKEGMVKGQVSVDRNSIPGKGGHAWVRYTNSGGKVFIIDPAQDYIGPLESDDNTSRWFYERPEDISKKED